MVKQSRTCADCKVEGQALNATNKVCHNCQLDRDHHKAQVNNYWEANLLVFPEIGG